MNQTPEIPALADIYEMWHVPFWQTTWFKICYGLIVLFVIQLAIGLAAYFINHRRKPKLTAWQQAFEQLQRLAQKYPATTDEARIYYTRLTHLLKQYIQKRYGRKLEGSTDNELIQQAQSHGLPEKASDCLREILEGAVLIKFARAEAREAQISRDLKHARTNITLSVPQPSATQNERVTK